MLLQYYILEKPNLIQVSKIELPNKVKRGLNKTAAIFRNEDLDYSLAVVNFMASLIKTLKLVFLAMAC